MNNLIKTSLFLAVMGCQAAYVAPKTEQAPYSETKPAATTTAAPAPTASSLPTSEPKQTSANKVFGLVGASNTVSGFGRESLDKIIKEHCQGAEVYISARGGTGPEQQVPLLQKLLEHENLDYVVLDTSANGQNSSDSGSYKAAATKLAQMVKDKNKDIKVIMLTNTPAKGAFYKDPETKKIIVTGDDKAVRNIKAYNKDLMENRLGRPDLIDYAVDTYSATEDPLGSDACGKYCTLYHDKIHFNTLGQRAVVKAMLDTVFGSP